MIEDAISTRANYLSEVSSRRQSDQRISVYVGQPINSLDQPSAVLPSYGVSLVDLVNSTPLAVALASIDSLKNSTLLISSLDAVVNNPRSVRMTTNRGYNGLYSDGSGYRININTISQQSFVTSVDIDYGVFAVIGLRTRQVTDFGLFRKQVQFDQ